MLVFLRILFENIHLAYKIVSVFSPDETGVIIVPAIGNGRAVGQDKHVPCTNALTKVVCRKSLAKAGFCIPQEFGSLVLFQDFHQFVVIEIIGGLSGGFFLFITEFVDFDAFHFGKDSVIFLKIIEMIFRSFCVGFEPLRFRFPFDIHLVCQVFMEIVITERRQVIFENSPSAPRNRGFGVGGVGLLMDAFLNSVF